MKRLAQLNEQPFFTLKFVENVILVGCNFFSGTENQEKQLKNTKCKQALQHRRHGFLEHMSEATL